MKRRPVTSDSANRFQLLKHVIIAMTFNSFLDTSLCAKPPVIFAADQCPVRLRTDCYPAVNPSGSSGSVIQCAMRITGKRVFSSVSSLEVI